MVDVDIAERLSGVETVVRNLDRRLYGNGQPGDIADLKRKLDQLLSWYWKAIGALAVAGFLTLPAVELLKYFLSPKG